MKDCSTGPLWPLLSDVTSVGLLSSAAVYCSKTRDPRQGVPSTHRLDASSSPRTEPSGKSSNFPNSINKQFAIVE